MIEDCQWASCEWISIKNCEKTEIHFVKTSAKMRNLTNYYYPLIRAKFRLWIFRIPLPVYKSQLYWYGFSKHEMNNLSVCCEMFRVHTYIYDMEPLHALSSRKTQENRDAYAEDASNKCRENWWTCLSFQVNDFFHGRIHYILHTPVKTWS